MALLTVTAKGQVTLKQELLRHLGVQPGQKIEVDILPDGRAILQAGRNEDIGKAFGMLAPKNTNNTVLTVDEINDLAQKSWASEK